MKPAGKSRHHQRLRFRNAADQITVEVNIDIVHRRLDDCRANQWRRSVSGRGKTCRADAQHHIRFVIAARIRRLEKVARSHVTFDICSNVLDHFVRGDLAVTRVVISLTLESLQEKIAEDSKAGRQTRVFITFFPFRCCGQRQETGRQILQLGIDTLICRFRIDFSGMAGIGEKNFPSCLDTVRKHVTERRHRVCRVLDAVGIDIPSGKIPLAAFYKTVAGEIYDDPVRWLCNGGKPFLQFTANVHKRRLFTFQ